MEQFQLRCWKEKLIWLLTTFLFASFIIFDTSSWISLILLATTAGILLLDAMQGGWVIRPALGPFHLFVLCFSLFCYASSLWAVNGSAAIEKGTTVLEILICMSVIYMHYAKHQTILPLLEVIRWAGYAVVLYALYFYGWDTIRFLASTGGRLDSSFANINSIGMTAAYAVVITAFRVFFINNRITWSDYLSIPAIIFVGLSGSRKTLVLAGLGFVLLVAKRFASKNLVKTILRLAILGLLIALLFGFLMTLPIFSAVSARMEGLIAAVTGKGQVDHSTWLRQQYIAAGIAQFWKTPLFGIGISNTYILTLAAAGRSTYLHNNYVELLAAGGIVGFCCYYSMYFYLLRKFFRYRKKADSCLVMCVVLIMLFLIMDYGAVSYYSKSTYFYFTMMFLEERNLRIEARKGNDE